MAKRILLIDDDPVTTRLMSTILVRGGYEVASVERVDDALETLDEQSFDLATCDLMLPGRNGLDFLSSIQEKGLTPRLPVVVVSATSFQAELDQARQMGAAGILAKPFTPQQLLDTVKSVI